MVVRRLNADNRLETLGNLRLPVRLGQDAFTSGLFCEPTMQMAVDAFLRFRNMADVFEVTQTRVVATSAMRETANSDLLIERIARETGFNIELISGEEEARLIHLAVTNTVNLKGKRVVLIDIGGGSVEVTLSDSENSLSTKSYGLGTVRLLKKLESADEKVEICLGTGGNIEGMGKLRKHLFKRDQEDMISLDDIERPVLISSYFFR